MKGFVFAIGLASAVVGTSAVAQERPRCSGAVTASVSANDRLQLSTAGVNMNRRG